MNRNNVRRLNNNMITVVFEDWDAMSLYLKETGPYDQAQILLMEEGEDDDGDYWPSLVYLTHIVKNREFEEPSPDLPEAS